MKQTDFSRFSRDDFSQFLFYGQSAPAAPAPPPRPARQPAPPPPPRFPEPEPARGLGRLVWVILAAALFFQVAGAAIEQGREVKALAESNQRLAQSQACEQARAFGVETLAARGLLIRGCL